MGDSLACELSTAEFGDKRLTKRLVTIVDSFHAKPNMSIPAATNGRAEMEGAYRFFNNDKVNPDAIHDPHRAATLERIRQVPVALLVQDTTELDLTRPRQQVKGSGPIASNSRTGAFYHPLMAFSTEGLALGTVWSKSWAREKIETELTQAKKADKRQKTPIEQKESMRWLEGLRAARSVAEECPETQCIAIADSESDIYELFDESRETGHSTPVELIIRASQNRALIGCDDCLVEAVRKAPLLYECTLDVSRRVPKVAGDTRKRREKRDARVAMVEVRAKSVTVRPPQRLRGKMPAVELNVVLVEEVNPPEGQAPIQWILITTLPIDEPEMVRLIVEYYCIRWQIEVYFKTLKSGCRIEARYFETLPALLNCVAVYAIVAWKILYLCRLSRECPDMDCEVVFTPSEWKSVYVAVNRKDPPKTPPTLNEMVRMIASLGGYVNRKSTSPGTQTLWFGLQRLHDLSTAWEAFGPDTRT
jgi:hypothetical protein